MAGERILIVDDDESIRQIVRICLTDEGYEVSEAPNGQVALTALSEFTPNLIWLSSYHGPLFKNGSAPISSADAGRTAQLTSANENAKKRNREIPS